MSNFLKAKEVVDEIKKSTINFSFKSKLQVIDQIIKKTKYEDPYIVISLRDITDTLRNVKRWISNDEKLEVQQKIFEIGNILEVDCVFEKNYNSIIIENAKILSPSEYNLEDFVAVPNINETKLINCLYETISKIKNSMLKNLLEEILNNEDIKDKYFKCPSSINKHHAYKHGNLEHIISMIKLFKTLEKFYERNTILDVDLIYAGIILHDIGKLYEYSIHNNVPKLVPGSTLYGHLILGVELVSKFMNNIEGFPKDLKNKIRHLILSHHGQKEWGTLVEPQFPEAEFLHYLDMIDSRYKLKS